MLASRCRLSLLLLALLIWLCACEEGRCLTEVPVPVPRPVTLKLASHDWLSHELLAKVGQLVLEEGLGYTVELVRHTNPANWGPDIAAGLYDMDGENWHADPSGDAYKQYIASDDAPVLDGGLIGYTGRSGVYTFRSALELNDLADYYKFYQNSTYAESLGFLTFGGMLVSQLQSEHASECDLAWCGEGEIGGFWATDKCALEPHRCLAILKENVTHEQAYFEQLVRASSVEAVFGYYGSDLEAYLYNAHSTQSGPVLFVWWEPTPLIARLDAVRISFPDHYPGCDAEVKRDPNFSSVACDTYGIPLRKVTAKRLGDIAPEVILVSNIMTVPAGSINGMLALTEYYSIPEVACLFVRGNYHLLPSCVYAPYRLETPYFTVVETFSDVTFTCVNQTIYPTVDPVRCFSEAERPGQVNRSDEEIVIVQQRWLSLDLVSTVAEIVLREFLGYTVRSIQHSQYEVSHVEDMYNGRVDLDMEVWEVERVHALVGPGIHYAGLLGYHARNGLYVIWEAVEMNAMADYYKFYRNASVAAAKGFLLHEESPLLEYPIGERPCHASFMGEWCGTEDLEGFWATPQCVESPGRCLEVAMASASWSYGIVEQLAKNLGLEVVVAYYGSDLWEVLPRVHTTMQKFVPFFAWEPDASLIRYNAKRISFPDYVVGCQENYTLSPAGNIECDFPTDELEKITSLRLTYLKEALFAIDSMTFSLADITGMMARHTDAGGPLMSLGEVACEFVEQHRERIEEWAPDCMVKPPAPEEIRFNDTVFSPEAGLCLPVVCSPNQILVYSPYSSSFHCEYCRLGEVPDEMNRMCRFCDAGEQPEESGTSCITCPHGQAALPRSSDCTLCPAGMYSEERGMSGCNECALGTHQSEVGASGCAECMAGQFADEVAATMCTRCDPGKYKPNGTAPHECVSCERGHFADGEGATACQKCAYGTTEILGAPGASYCQCASGEFYYRETACIRCNEYMEPCLGARYPAQQQAGYHISLDGQTVYRCASDEACPRGALGTCSPGSSGRGCAECQVGRYVWNGDQCVACTAADNFFAILVPLAMICVLVMTYKYGNDPVSRKISMVSEFIVLVGMTMNIFFYLNSFHGFDIVWEEPVRSAITASAKLTSELTSARISCSVRVGSVTNYVLASTVPGVIVLIFLFMALTALGIPWKLFNTLATITYALYLLLLLHGLKPLRYIVHPLGDAKSVLDMPSVFEGSTEHTGLVVCGICVLLAYCVPFAVACLYATVSTTRARTMAQRRRWLVWFRFLFYKFRPESYYWGVYILARNAMFALAPSIAPSAPKFGIFVLTLVAAGSVAHTAFVDPWRKHWMSIVDVFILCYILLVLNLAAGWARSSTGTDEFVARLLFAVGCAAIVAAGTVVAWLALELICASAEVRRRACEQNVEEEAEYLSDTAEVYFEGNMEVSDSFQALQEAESSTQRSGHTTVLAWPLLAMRKLETKLELLTGIAESIVDPKYSLQHFYEDCVQAFPELQLYDMRGLYRDVSLPGSTSNPFDRSDRPRRNTTESGLTMAEELQRTIGALFAVYCLCRLRLDGKQILSFGVVEDEPHKVNSPPADCDQEMLKGIPWARMSAPQRRANFFFNFNWALMESLLVEAGILLHDGTHGLVVDKRRDGRLVAMLSLTAYHDIMKDKGLCPTVADASYEGVHVGESITDHDLALAYILDRHPDVLPSFRILSHEQKRLVRFTQSEMGFNAGWLVQAEGPPAAVLQKLKSTINRGGVQEADVAFYFVHWVTDLAGAEPTPWTGSEKFAAKFPPFVLQGLLGCFSIVKRLAAHTETEVYEAYLRERWREAVSCTDDLGKEILPSGKDAIARMRLFCMAQAGAKQVLEAFDLLDDDDRMTLVQELAATGLPDQEYSDWKSCGGPQVGTPFLFYYGPAWCQRVGQSHPGLALKVLASVFRLGRHAYPESLSVAVDQAEGIFSRTVQVGLLKTLDIELLEGICGPTELGSVVEEKNTDRLVVRRGTRLEGTLDLIQELSV